MLVTITFVLCGCIPQPFAKQTISKPVDVSTDDTNSNDNPSDKQTRTLYVSGAVQSDGYVDVPILCDYKTLFGIVGLVEYSAVPPNASRLLDRYLNIYVVDFVFDDEVCVSVDVNGAAITGRQYVDGVSREVVNKLADYIELNGKITNRLQLKSALSEDYDDNYYKFYIDVSDYA